MSLRLRLILPALLSSLTLTSARSEAGFGLYTLGDYNGLLSISAVDSSGNAKPVAQVLTGGNALAVDSSGNFYVSTYTGEQVEKYSSTGKDLGVFASNLGSPDGLITDKAGNLYVAERSNGLVEKYSPTGQDLGTFASGLNSPARMAFDSAGNLYVTSGYGVARFSSTGQSLGFLNTDGPTISIAIDSANNVYASQYFFNGTPDSILKFSSTGQSLGIFASTNLHQPGGLGFDSSGNLYAANAFGGPSGANIEKFSATGQDLGNFASISAVDLAFSPQAAVVVPEPASMVMVGLGLAAVTGFARICRARASFGA